MHMQGFAHDVTQTAGHKRAAFMAKFSCDFKTWFFSMPPLETTKKSARCLLSPFLSTGHVEVLRLDFPLTLLRQAFKSVFVQCYHKYWEAKHNWNCVISTQNLKFLRCPFLTISWVQILSVLFDVLSDSLSLSKTTTVRPGNGDKKSR